jgi:hypothetical protein
MREELFGALQGTPVWVWPLLGFTLYLGIRALRLGNASLLRLAIVPTIFLAWDIHATLTTFEITYGTLAVWCAGLGLGLAAGLWAVKAINVEVDPETGLLCVPGSAQTLIVSLSVFALAYAMGYSRARWPDVMQNPIFIFAGLFLSGLFPGLLIGRLAGFAKVYFSASREMAV